jgi:hypothetical protein
VICILLAGCGSAGTGKENQDPTTKEIGQTTADESEIIQTEVRTFMPFDSQGRLDLFTGILLRYFYICFIVY